MAFDNKSALNHAIRYLTQVAERRAAGGWLPPKERERQQRDAMRQEQQQARQVEKQQQAQQKQLITDEKERRKNLADWHKGSHPETLNPDGTPRVFYHGTGGDFSVFNPEHRSDAVRSIFLSHTPEFANQFATEDYPSKKGKDANIMPVYALAKNPFDYKDTEHVNQVLKNLRNDKYFMEDYGADFADYAKGIAEGDWQYLEDPWVQDAIQNRHDGFFAQGNGHRFLSVYSPHQIKSATGNQGTFNPSNPDITKSEGGQILSKQYPTHYMPNVGRQVMNTGGVPDQPQRQLSPMGFYSAAAERAQTLQPSGDAVQMVNALKNTQGIKTEELQNAGLIDQSGNVHPDWAGRGKVTREDLVSHLQGQMPQIEERVLGMKPTGYGHKTSDEWNEAVAQAELAGNWDEANRLQEAWEQSESAPTKYHQYTLPGGENYREVLLKLPYQKNEDLEKLQQTLGDLVKKRTDATAEYKRIAEELSPEHPAADEARSKITEYNIPIATIKQGIDQIVEEERRKGFRSGHWDDTNVLAHIRMSDRTGPNGEKILHVEELQSDWGQKGKKEGFDTPEMRSKLLKELPEGYVVKPSDYQRTGGVTRYSVFDPNGVEVGIGNGRENAINSTLNYLNDQIRGTSASLVPSAPYVTSTEGWTDLALKRVLKEAVEGGYDKVVWTPGAEQAKRYNLSKYVSRIAYNPEEKSLGYISHNMDGWNYHPEDLNPEDLPNVIGKEATEKLLSKKPDAFGTHDINISGVVLGGEGMKGYYDSIVPKRLQNLAKKYDKNAKLGYTETHHRGQVSNAPMSYTFPSLDITPAMRESIIRGQPAYKRGGTVSKKHPALSIAGVHIREEEHGEPMFTGRL